VAGAAERFRAYRYRLAGVFSDKPLAEGAKRVCLRRRFLESSRFAGIPRQCDQTFAVLRSNRRLWFDYEVAGFADCCRELSAAGYQEVFDYQGGLEEWQNGGYPLQGDTKLRETPIFAGDRTVKVLAEESIVEWTGRSLTGQHHGTIGLRDGSISLRRGKPMSGHFILDLQTIACTDIPDPNLRQVLIHHLQSEDFFNVAQYSEARFTIEAFQLQSGATEGRPNYQVQGRLLLRGVERPLSFGAFIGQPFEENKLLARANFDIDRTEWGVLYGSGKFYEKLGKHLVNDYVSLDLKIVAV
jgi:polyisoprenoid-binding protein YceI